MPQRGWLCVFSNEPKSFDECLTCSRTDQHCEFTPEMLSVMWRNAGNRKKDPNNPSVTAILKDCLRQVVIQDRFDYYVSPRKQFYAFRGNMIHQILEGTMKKDGWKEIYFSRELKLPDGTTVRLGGMVDKIVPEKLLIRDYKTTRRVPTQKSGSYGTHALQLNAYRWIWWPVFQAEKLRLQYLDMSETKSVKVELMDIKEIEEILSQKAFAYVKALKSPEIPEREYDAKNWLCRYCDVQNICKELKTKEDEHATKKS